MVLVCIGTGTNKDGKPYSKLVPVVETKNGDQYLGLKNPVYVDAKHPLFKRFVSELKAE